MLKEHFIVSWKIDEILFLRLVAWVLSCSTYVLLFATLWTIAHRVPLSMGFSRQEYWSGLPFPSTGALPDPEIDPPALADGLLTSSTTWEAPKTSYKRANLSKQRAFVPSDIRMLYMEDMVSSMVTPQALWVHWYSSDLSALFQQAKYVVVLKTDHLRMFLHIKIVFTLKLLSNCSNAFSF